MQITVEVNLTSNFKFKMISKSYDLNLKNLKYEMKQELFYELKKRATKQPPIQPPKS